MSKYTKPDTDVPMEGEASAEIQQIKDQLAKAYVTSDTTYGSASSHTHAITNHNHSVSLPSINSSPIIVSSGNVSGISLSPEPPLEEPVEGLRRAKEAVERRRDRLSDELKDLSERYDKVEEELNKVALVLDQYDKLIEVAENETENDPEEDDQEGEDAFDPLTDW